MEFSMMLQIILMACGIYMCYWAVQMKSTNTIPTVLVGKGYSEEKAKDPKGFIKHTFPFTFITGVVIFISALINAVRLFEDYALIEILFNAISVTIVIIYAYFLTKAQKKYLYGVEDKKKNKK